MGGMDDIRRLRQFTKLSQQDKNRFELEWCSSETGLETHVMLYDLGGQPEAVAHGHGANEAETLLDLWTAPSGQAEPSDALAVVADAYVRRTGRQPGQTDESPKG